MNILAFVDTHGRPLDHIRNYSKNADVIVCAGDWTIFESDIQEGLRFLNSIGKPVILIHGNHETASSAVAASSDMPNIHFIHKSHHIIDDVIFFGYGGGGFGETDSKFEIVSEDFIKTLPDIEKKAGKSLKFVLVTHAPPYGTKLDNIGYHVGSKSIFDFIEKNQPLVHICGHIHECAGNQDQIGKTITLNPGPKGKIIEV